MGCFSIYLDLIARVYRLVISAIVSTISVSFLHYKSKIVLLQIKGSLIHNFRYVHKCAERTLFANPLPQPKIILLKNNIRIIILFIMIAQPVSYITLSFY